MSDLIIYQRDKGFNLAFTVQDADAAVYNLTDYTVRLKVWPPGNTAGTIVSGTCTLSNPTLGSATYTVGSADFITARIYLGELELTKSGVIETTNPFTIEVKESPV